MRGFCKKHKVKGRIQVYEAQTHACPVYLGTGFTPNYSLLSKYFFLIQAALNAFKISSNKSVDSTPRVA